MFGNLCSILSFWCRISLRKLMPRMHQETLYSEISAYTYNKRLVVATTLHLVALIFDQQFRISLITCEESSSFFFDTNPHPAHRLGTQPPSQAFNANMTDEVHEGWILITCFGKWEGYPRTMRFSVHVKRLNWGSFQFIIFIFPFHFPSLFIHFWLWGVYML